MTTVTREMIGAAHDVMLAKGDFVLSANLLERIYLAMDQAAPPPQTPFDTCPTCEALARAVMMDQTGAAQRRSQRRRYGVRWTAGLGIWRQIWNGFSATRS